MTEDHLLAFLQAKLPGGRPYEVPGSYVDWCRGERTYWSWPKPASAGPDQPDVIDRLFVQVIGSNIVQIERDARDPFKCDPDVNGNRNLTSWRQGGF